LIRTVGFEPVKADGIEQSSRLEVGGDLHDLVIGPAQARSLIGGAAARSWRRRCARGPDAGPAAPRGPPAGRTRASR
jgi:hypothetical protein